MPTPNDAREDEPLDPRLAALLAALPRTAAPPTAQWGAIERRLAARPVAWRRAVMRVALAASVALLVGVLIPRADAPEPPSRRARAPSAAEAFEAALSGRTDLDQPTIDALRRNMAVIDSAVADSRRALAAAPEDQEITAVVQFAEAQRQALLAQLARLQES